MTSQEEYDRLVQDESELYDEVEHQNEVLRQMDRLGEESDEWNEQFDYVTALQNELSYLQACLKDYE